MSTFPLSSVRLVLREECIDDIEPVCVLSYKDGETLCDLRRRITTVLDFPFDFWDDRLPGRVKEAAEKLLPLEEMGQTIVVTRKYEDVSLLGSQEGGSSHSIGKEDPPVPEETMPVVEDANPFLCLNSQLMCAVSSKIWEEQAKKLVKWSKSQGLDDHQWKVQTWDEDGKIFAHLNCLECMKKYSACSRPENISTIKNIFSNFKYKHVSCDQHRGQYCKNRGIEIGDAPKKDDQHVFDHEVEVKNGEDIVKRINIDHVGLKDPFLVTGSNVPGPVKAYVYKVRCAYCLHTFELVPRMRNLEHNLLTHLSSQKHLDAVELFVTGKDSVLPVRSGKRGRPKHDARDQSIKQASVLHFFKVEEREKATSSTSDKGLDLGLTSLCWGYWIPNVTWREYSGNIKSILHDQSAGNVWYSEQNVKALVYNPFISDVSVIEGCFRHVDCSRISQFGAFLNLMCSKCFNITLEDDFRGRVIRETKAEVKRGGRTTATGLRLDYLTNEELREQARVLTRDRRKSRFYQHVLELRICALSVKRRQLDDMLVEAAQRKDMKLFLRNIINAHTSGAFGGRESLWEFLKDIGKNIHRKAEGFRYSKNTKAIAQAMLQFGGRQIAHIFADNLAGPSLKTLKRDKSKLIQFRTGIRQETFQEVGRVLAAAKKMNNIIGDVPVIIGEDETRIKPRARWEAKYDVLIGFCGKREEHMCSFGLEVPVGEGTEGYENIISTFQNFDQAMYARVCIVNPLHEALPRLALCAIPTCNKFTADWIREQWNELKCMWDIHCRNLVGPIIGHASDGDSRRRKLMLEDYLGHSSLLPRYCVGWEGWKMSVSILSNGDLFGFGDQDQPHNGKKAINPLDRVSNVLVLGDQIVNLNHLEKVYNIYSKDQHGLSLDDIKRTDRQNWAGPQRLASRKVQSLLHDLCVRNDNHRENTLGTRLYLEIVGDYIDIFFSLKLTIRDRIVAAAKVSFFFDFGDFG